LSEELSWSRIIRYEMPGRIVPTIGFAKCGCYVALVIVLFVGS
jgi:hypothetical protein